MTTVHEVCGSAYMRWRCIRMPHHDGHCWGRFERQEDGVIVRCEWTTSNYGAKGAGFRRLMPVNSQRKEKR